MIRSSQLVPSDPSANLAVTVEALPNPATVSQPLTYTLCVSNQGPNIARSTILAATLSDSQTIQSVVASAGTPVTSGLAVTLPVGDIAAAACVTLTITTLPQSAGSLTCIGDNRAAVFDGFVRRPDRSGIYTVDRIERTATPGIFVGYVNSISNYRLSRLSVTASGVSISQYVESLIVGAREIRGAGYLILASTGTLVDSSNFTLLANLGASGSPCLDPPNHRAYLVNGNILRGYDTVTSLATETFTLPISLTGDGAQRCIRWGLDGFAILGNDGVVYILRWSSTIPAATDANSDGISDAWEAAYFGALNVDPAADSDGDGILNFQEYIFATSPLEASSDQLQVSTTSVGGRLALRLVFPRRAGLVPRPYDYVISPDLAQWTVAPNVSETVLSVQSVDGTQIETVEALIPAVNPKAGFVRFRWNPQ